MPSKLHGPVSLDKLAERMTATLARTPKKQRTCKLLASLPKRDRVTVTADDYLDQKRERAQQFAEAKAVAKGLLERLSRGEGVIAPKPKRRLRPRARTKWACRPSGVRHRDGLTLGPKQPRDMLTVGEQRARLYSAQTGICGLCGGEMDAGEKNSIDHVIPRFDGGADALGNLLLSHGECNGAKSNDVPTGCELVMLLAINARLGIGPLAW